MGSRSNEFLAISNLGLGGSDHSKILVFALNGPAIGVAAAWLGYGASSFFLAFFDSLPF